MPTDNLPDGPVIRRRSTGEIRTDIVITTDHQQPLTARPRRQPIRVVGRPRRRSVPQPRAEYTGPGKATGLATIMASYGHLFRVVLVRYLVVCVVLGGIVLLFTKTMWLALAAAGLPLLVFIWYALMVHSQARAYRRGEAGPPPGYLGRL